MFRIKTLNKISPAGLSVLDRSRFQVGDDVENEDGILVRSANMHEFEFPETLRAIARAGAGTNNIPLDRCSEAGIVVFNTPGANANAVKELVLCALLLASRDVIGGYEFVQEQAYTAGVDLPKAVEKGKSNAAGEIVIGFADMDRSGYLDRLYVHKDHQRQGVASALCDRLEKEIEADRYLTHASITARPFFEKRGYKTVREQQVERNGVLLTNYVMERKNAD